MCVDSTVCILGQTTLCVLNIASQIVGSFFFENPLFSYFLFALLVRFFFQYYTALSNILFCLLIRYQKTYTLGYQNNPAAQAAGADPSRCNSTSRQNPPIQQKRRNFWTDTAILMPFRIYIFWKKCQHSLFYDWKNHLTVWAWRWRKYILPKGWLNLWMN